MLSTPNNSINEICNIIEKNQNKLINFRQLLTSNVSYENEFYQNISHYLNDLSFDFRTILSALDRFKSSNLNLSNSLQNCRNQVNDLCLKNQNFQQQIFSLESSLLNANHQIQDLNILNQKKENYIQELLNRNCYNICSDYRCCCCCHEKFNNTYLKNSYNGSLCPLFNEKSYDLSNKSTMIYDTYIKDNNNSYEHKNKELNNFPDLDDKKLNLNFDYNNIKPNINDMNTIKNIYNNMNNESQRDNIEYNNIDKKINFNNLENYKPISSNLEDKNFIDNSNNKNNIEEIPKTYEFNYGKGDGLKNDNIVNNDDEFINNSQLLEDKKENEKLKNKNENITNKISRITNIVNDAFKDEKTIKFLKQKFGDDFEDKFNSDAVTEEFISQIEEALKEYKLFNQNEDNNNIDNSNISKNYNNKFVVKKKSDLLKKLELKQQITDKQYRYREYPRGWNSSKDYFVNNGTGNPISKSPQKITTNQYYY
jgi:hypothetical protein